MARRDLTPHRDLHLPDDLLAAEAEVFGVGRARIVMHLGRPMVGVGTEDYQAAKGHGDPSSARTEPLIWAGSWSARHGCRPGQVARSVRPA